MERKRKPFKHSTTFYRKKKHLSNSKIDNLLRVLDTNTKIKILEPCRMQNTSPNHLSSLNENIVNQSTSAEGNEKRTEAEDAKGKNTIAEDYEQIYSQTMLNEFEDEDEDIEARENDESLRKSLREWVFKFNIKHTALSGLLSILINNGHKQLPKDSRTLLFTPKVVPIESMGSGQFWYRGIKNCLIRKFSKTNESVELRLNFHIDGLPINSSSKNQFWPILMMVANFPIISPQVVAIYSGTSKPPSAAEFLKQFVNELKELLENGLTINEHLIKLKVNAFICDTPARCYIKGVVPYNAYHGCMKCEVVGEYHRGGRHMSYPQTDCILRTDEGFRNKSDPDHHQKNNTTDEELLLNSPLEELPIDMIKDIIIADSLHLLDLGIMKRCLKGWVKGDFNFKTKFFSIQVETISKWLIKMNSNIPSEIHRAVRGFDCLAFWKATEYRTFLLYLGPVILKGHLDIESYKHFLLIFCAVTILSTKYYLEKDIFLLTAETMLIDYIETFITIYGVDAISSNIHNLCHIIEDVKRFGPLPDISSYPFENALGLLKGLLRSGNQPLAQVAKRILEISTVDDNTEIHSIPKPPILKNEILNLLEMPPDCKSLLFKTIKFPGVEFKANTKNQWILTKQNYIVKILGAYNFENSINIFGSSLKSISNFFEYPFESSLLNIYISSCDLKEPETYKISDIKCKLVSLEYNENVVFIPLLHTLELFS